MQEIVTIYLPWLLSTLTIAMAIMNGSMHRYTWLFGLLLQTLWLLWIVVTKEWGFFPMNIAFWIIYTRNHFLWKIKLGKNRNKLL